jgi:hypothetical protein
LNEKTPRTAKKKNTEGGNKRKVPSQKENIVDLTVHKDRPKRTRKSPDRFTY